MIQIQVREKCNRCNQTGYRENPRRLCGCTYMYDGGNKKDWGFYIDRWVNFNQLTGISNDVAEQMHLGDNLC
jgi:hypothetical protein